MKIAVRTAAAEGVAVSAMLLIFAPWLPKIFGISNTALLPICITAVRIMASTLALSSFIYLFSSYYLLLEKLALSFVLSAVGNLIAPLILAAFLGTMLGLDGIGIGFALTPLLTISLFSLFVLKKYGKDRFPLLFEKSTEQNIFSHDLTLSQESIINLRNNAEAFLCANAISHKTVLKIMLVIEEVCLFIAERNPDKTVLSECTIIIDDDIRVILRDNGAIFNIIDTDTSITSLRSYVVASVMEKQTSRAYLTTTSNNRNIFVFPK